MGEVDALADACRRLLSENGRLSTSIPGFVPRASQSDMASAIALALEEKTSLVAEVGTGTGKTFAYLLPCLLSGKKILISTATKTLQDQLFQKDLPTLVKALGLSCRMQNLKGRSNYICQYRLELYAQQGQFQSVECAHEISIVWEKLSQMINGERSELIEIHEDSPVWHYVTSTADNCLGKECPNIETCFLVKARKRAMNADVVVINHHLFFADSRLKQTGFGELLPGVDVLIFDEAHQLAEIATHFYTNSISTRQFRDLIQDLLSAWPSLDLPNRPLKVLSHKAQILMDQLQLSYASVPERVNWETLSRHPALKGLLTDWLSLIKEVKACFDETLEKDSALSRCQERLEVFETNLFSFMEEKTEMIRWVERFKHSLVFQDSPYDIGQSFRALLKVQTCSYIFTSATLTFAASFDSFCKPLGLLDIKTLLLPSPFDFKQQALLYLPRGLPDPRDSDYYERLLDRAIPVIRACGGRCFFLFTSHKALREVAERLPSDFEFPLLIQGDEAKSILLARFKQLGNAVLLGTASFWEGVDVKGESLSCVIIDKIPFANPTDPLVQGKMTHLKRKGLSPFDELSLPNAVIALKQGAGRLIRDVGDKGLLMLADPRLLGRTYGGQILASLPPIPKTRDFKRVMNFINDLALNEEPFST